MEIIAFDSHKRYTVCSVENEKGGIIDERRINHERGALRAHLERFTPGSPVAVETIGNWYRIVDEIEEAKMKPLLVHARKAKKGYTLDLDSTVFQRYGKQDGAAKGYNPQKLGHSPPHPILAVLAEAHCILHGWLRSGNSGTARGVVEFLKEAVALLPTGLVPRCVRADSGFFDDKLLAFLEGLLMKYIVVARMTKWMKKYAAGVKEWRALDGNYSVGEFTGTLLSIFPRLGEVLHGAPHRLTR